VTSLPNSTVKVSQSALNVRSVSLLRIRAAILAGSPSKPLLSRNVSVVDMETHYITLNVCQSIKYC